MKWSKVIYVPQANWKYGERTAIGRLRAERADVVLPLFRLFPPGDFDPDLQATITPDLYLKTFGAQLAEVRGRRPALIDGSLIQEIRNQESGRLLFSELLERSRLAGAFPIPVLEMGSSNPHIASGVEFAKRSTDGAICLKVGVGDLEFFADRSSLRGIVQAWGLSSKQCILLVDAGGLTIHDAEDFSTALANQISRLVVAGDWQLLIWSGTTFPEQIKLKAGQSGAYDRADWKLYRHMNDNVDNFSVFPVFSDYMLEYPNRRLPIGRTPTAQLRYSTENRYFIFKGDSVRKADKYKNIYPVARALVGSGVFKGEDFSKGDAFIKELTGGNIPTGHAGTWRWCSSDHHITLVTNQLAAVFGLEIEKERLVVEPDQMRLV